MGLRALGVEKGDRVAILSENRPEWAYRRPRHAAARAPSTSPIYATLTPPQVLYILNDSEAKVIFVSNAAQARKVAEVRAQAPAPAPRDPHGRRPDRGHALARGGAGAGRRGAPPKDKDAVRKRAAEVKAGGPGHAHLHLGHHRRPQGRDAHALQPGLERARVGQGLRRHLGTDDVGLSFLPLCHVFERMGGHYLMLLRGRHHRLRGERREGPREHARGAAHRDALGAAPLREDVRAGQREGGRATRPSRQKIFRWALGVGREIFRHTGRAHASPASG